MRSDIRAAYAAINEAYETIHQSLKDLAERTRKESDPQELANTALAMREGAEMVKRLKIQAESIGQTAQRMACMVAITCEMDVIKTDHVHATPDLAMHANIPSQKKEPEKFAKLMDYLGIPRELWDFEDPERHKVVDVQWPGLVELITEKVSQGHPLPEGISADSTNPIYRLKMRRRRGILED